MKASEITYRPEVEELNYAVVRYSEINDSWFTAGAFYALSDAMYYQHVAEQCGITVQIVELNA